MGLFDWKTRVTKEIWQEHGDYSGIVRGGFEESQEYRDARLKYKDRVNG